MIFSALTLGQLSAQKAELWYLPKMNLFQAENIAKYDLAVLDLENMFNNPEMIDVIVEQNPDIVLLVYWNLTEWFSPIMFDDKPWSIKMLAELKKRPGYWLKQSNGQAVSFWPKMQTLNLSDNCPRVNGQNYREFIIDSLQALMKQPSFKKFQGFLIDNTWENESWLVNRDGIKDIDSDLNGRPDDLRALDISFQRGVRLFLNDLRRLVGEKGIIIINPYYPVYSPFVNGGNLEDFPFKYYGDLTNGGWDINLAYANNGKPYMIFNAREDNLFFTMCSAKLSDNIFVCYKQNEFWHDYYDLNLGKPLGTKKEIAPNIYERKFSQGILTVDAAKATAKIKYKNGQTRIK